jgi:hypothetical protein
MSVTGGRDFWLYKIKNERLSDCSILKSMLQGCYNFQVVLLMGFGDKFCVVLIKIGFCGFWRNPQVRDAGKVTIVVNEIIDSPSKIDHLQNSEIQTFILPPVLNY